MASRKAQPKAPAKAPPPGVPGPPPVPHEVSHWEGGEWSSGRWCYCFVPDWEAGPHTRNVISDHDCVYVYIYMYAL